MTDRMLQMPTNQDDERSYILPALAYARANILVKGHQIRQQLLTKQYIKSYYTRSQINIDRDHQSKAIAASRTMSGAKTSVADPRAITRDIFSATIGSVACCYTGQPLDTIKVRMQTNPGQFSSVVGSTMSIYKNEVSNEKPLL